MGNDTNDELELLTEFTIDRNIIKDVFEEGGTITEQDIETDLFRILKDNNIDYKVKINEQWSDGWKYAKVPQYNMIAEVYVDKNQYEKAIGLLSSGQLDNEVIDELIDEDETTNNVDASNNDDTQNKTTKKRPSMMNILSIIIIGFPLVAFFGLMVFWLISVVFDL